MKFFSAALAALSLVLSTAAFADSPVCRPISLSCFAQEPNITVNTQIEGSTCLFTTQVTLRGQVYGTPYNFDDNYQGGMWSLETSGIANLRSPGAFLPTTITVFYSFGRYYADWSNAGGAFRMSCNRYQ
jgi:hypothetical protein